MKEFKDKVAVITGGASGIGRALADRCAQEGMNIVLADIEEDALVTAKSELEATGVSALAVQTDVSQAEDIETLAEKTIEKFGHVHLLFNNAGVGAPGAAWECSLDDWKWVLDVNLWGVIYGVHVFTPLMIKQDTECHIVNTASTAGLGYTTYMGPYGVSKYGIVALSESLYLELKDIESKVNVSVLCPGFVKTRLDKSDRNRPVGYKSVDSLSKGALEMIEFLNSSLGSGMSPERVSDMVFDAIKEERLYILTHKDWIPEIEKRMKNVINERNPL
jgi:NAD(P)-dependent dehydrogenase (short-subunit alcohol dehydrogenase family)